jgi:hypothetical protein
VLARALPARSVLAAAVGAAADGGAPDQEGLTASLRTLCLQRAEAHGRPPSREQMLAALDAVLGKAPELS